MSPCRSHFGGDSLCPSMFGILSTPFSTHYHPTSHAQATCEQDAKNDHYGSENICNGLTGSGWDAPIQKRDTDRHMVLKSDLLGICSENKAKLVCSREKTLYWGKGQPLLELSDFNENWR